MSLYAFERPGMPVGAKLWSISRTVLILTLAIAGVGTLGLYSAGNGSFEPWAGRHLLRFGIFFGTMIAMAVINVRWWYRLAYPLYGATLLLLVAVEVAGHVGGLGAQRWINIGPIQLQPSEIMKITLVLAVARWLHGQMWEDMVRITVLVPALLLILVPMVIVLKQPNLGTALMLLIVGTAMLFLAGVRLWKFAVVVGSAAGGAPIAYRFMHGYQKKRVDTFLDPSQDPLGAGYHITQSKIALGSGGLEGKGFLQGTQSHLNFLPEKHTDFIFTLLAEEWGLWGALVLLALYAMLVFYGMIAGLRSRSQFGRMVALGLSVNLFVYVFINIAMVIGLIPVVGVPLPLISYGGSSMMSVMLGLGILLSILVHRDVKIGRAGE